MTILFSGKNKLQRCLYGDSDGLFRHYYRERNALSIYSIAANEDKDFSDKHSVALDLGLLLLTLDPVL